MPKPPKLKKITSAAAVRAYVADLPHRPGLPARDSVVAVSQCPKYTILHTQEADRYDTGTEGLGLAAAPEALKPPPAGDDFAGKDRKAAKLSIAGAPIEKFKDVQALIAKLTPDNQMISHKPKISTKPTQDRVKEENHNIHVNAFLYAA